jgi:hypothetical protein
MADKLLIEISLADGDAAQAVRALVFLANEIVECSTIEIADVPEWRERASDAYQLKWRFAEDAFSSWQLSIGVDLALQINDALRVAQSMLDKPTRKRREDSSNAALEAIKKAQAELFSFINKAEPELSNLIAE